MRAFPAYMPDWPGTAQKLALPDLKNMQQLGLFPAAAAAQLLMYFLAIGKGMNPDINGRDIHPELGDIHDFFFPPGTHGSLRGFSYGFSRH